jgi:hypothetical protein
MKNAGLYATMTILPVLFAAIPSRAGDPVAIAEKKSLTLEGGEASRRRCGGRGAHNEAAKSPSMA